MFAVGIIDELAEGHAGFGGRTAHDDSNHCQKDRTDCDGSQHCFEVSSEMPGFHDMFPNGCSVSIFFTNALRAAFL